MLTDGGSLRETLTSVDRPHGYAYVLDDLARQAPAVRGSIEGAWSVTPHGTGAQIGWAWTLHPAAPPARLTMNVIGRMWKGYADRALEELETILMRS